ncbi:MAG: 4a-hydroxytetrahydrobiopterin dehydratase [Polynucleobacter sp.]
MTQAQVLSSNFDFKKAIPGWNINLERDTIDREFIFTNFECAFEFMGLCAKYAEKINHHPDWSNSWNKVNVRLSTHSMKTLTELDILMAQAMDRFAQQISLNA